MKRLKAEFLKLIEALLFVDNPNCAICGRVLFGASPVCRSCSQKLVLIGASVCASCGEATDKKAQGLCDKCKTVLTYLTNGVCLFEYDDNSKNIIYDIKYNHNSALAVCYGRELYKKLEENNFGSFDIITYVPIHEEKLLKRGYNQAERIAFGITEKYAMSPCDCLVLLKATRDQIELSNEERFCNVSDAFGINPDFDIKGKRILLVDDVTTTGATLNECSKVLLRAGASEVIFATIASA